jgi:signal peptidase I
MRFRAGSFVLGGVVTLIVVWLAGNLHIAKVGGDAMAPAYVAGEVVLVRAFGYAPHRGDVVLLSYPLDPAQQLIDRVIALQGVTVHIYDGHVYLNDKSLAESYVQPVYRDHGDWGPMVIAQGYCFVMGDHRNASSDSRHWGMVPIAYVQGKVIARLWPPRW